MAIKMHESHIIHPGDWLKTEIVEAHGLNIASVARHLRVSRQAMSSLLHGHAALSASMAIRFEKAFGIKADTLMRMQAMYDLVQARKHEDKIEVEPLAA